MNTMDLKLNREMLSMTRTILDASCEQAVEKDFLLPDYYPDIFRVLKCVITPTVQSHSINGGKLSFDMAVLIRVLYISQNDKRINCIEQKMNYTKSFDLQGDCGDPMIWLTPKCDYVNCRVVNQRRLDIRGAVTTRTQNPLNCACPNLTGLDCRASKPAAAARFLHASYSVSSKPTRVSKRSREALEKIRKRFPVSRPLDGVYRKATAVCSSSSRCVASSAVAGFLMISSLKRL